MKYLHVETPYYEIDQIDRTIVQPDCLCFLSQSTVTHDVNIHDAMMVHVS